MSPTHRCQRPGAATTATEEDMDNSSKHEEQDPGEEEEILATTEMGYILLQRCSIYLPREAMPRQKWIDVKLLSTAGDSTVATLTAAVDPNTPSCCSHCNLVLHRLNKGDDVIVGDDDADEIQLGLCTTRASRFQGTMADTVHTRQQQQHTSPHRKCRQKRRSDAALFLGAILDAQDHGYASIQNMQVLLLDKNDGDEDGDCNVADKLTVVANGASLLVTLAFPSLATSSGSNNPRELSKSQMRRSKQSPPQLRVIGPASGSRKSNATLNLKPLPPSVQFLLSVIRSDWGRLGGTMRQLVEIRDSVSGPSIQDKRKTGKHMPTFFPSKLSLEELYNRIRGSSSRVEELPEQSAPPRPQSAEDHELLDLLRLPIDIMNTQIAPFLRAKSLDALRCTCKSFHRKLRAVVPGLKLRLFRHQIKSLQWMRQREIEPLSEAKGAGMLLRNINHDDNSVNAMVLEDDNDSIRAMTGGQTVWLRPKGENTQGIRFDQFTGNEIDEHGMDVLARLGARGGFLCDEPGLGKTITILSLILQTMGVSTECDSRHAKPAAEEATTDIYHSPEEEIFRAYWKEQVPQNRRPALYRLTAKLIKLDPSSGLFLRPIDPDRDGCEDYLDIIKNPMCINDVNKRISADQYGVENSDFDAFVSDVELCFRNAMEYNPENHEVHSAAKNLLDRFQRELVVQFKQEQLGSLRSSASKKPNSSVAVLMQRKSEQEFQQSLIQSSTTLLVIPSVLMEHWEEQIKMHVNFRYCTSKQTPLIYEYTPARKSALGLEEALRLCQVERTHFPFIFIDKAGTHKLPSPEFLAMFAMVLTTTKRFTNEWKNGSFQEELQRRPAEDESAVSDGKYVNYRLMEYGSTDEEACPLLKVNWLRMIVDEGHTMGRGKGNSAIRFAAWITAERRWAMTGTPTQQSASHNGLSNMLGLMQYLQHDFFTSRKGGDKVWKRLIARSWKDGHLASFFRLKSLLSLLMTRHTKVDIEELPLPIYDTSIVPMSPLEITTYNTLCCAIQQNLKLCSMKARTSGEQDSLLNRAQAKHALLALTNIRRVCCGGTRVVPRVEHVHYVEFVDLCRHQHSLPDSTVRDLEMYLGRATTEQLSRCYCCGMLLSTLLVMPCGCLLCTECTDTETNVCVMCDKAFDVDEFQRLQPGLIFEWLKTETDLQDSKEAKDSNSGINGASTAANNGPNGEASNNLEAEEGIVQIEPVQNELLLRPPSERRRTRKAGDGHLCEYSRSFEPGKCTLCFGMHNHCKLVNQNSSCQVCFQRAEHCPKQESKSHFLVNKLLRLYDEDQKKANDFTPLDGFGQLHGVRGLGSNRRRLKVIVFSQFRVTLNLVGDRLLRRFGTSCVAEYWGSYRTAELHKFIHDPDCFIMFLGKDGSEGLDLSFVTHLFFLEAIWDKSLEQQAVARAWRMGATGPVKVEVLLAKDSVEEQMYMLEEAMATKDLAASTKGTARDDDVEGIFSASLKEHGAEYQRAKVHFFLKSLKLIPELELVPLAAPEEVEKRFGSQRMSAIEDIVEAEEPQSKKRKTLPRHVRFAVA